MNRVAPEHVEILGVFLVIKILAEATDIYLVEADETQNPGELGVDILALKSDVLAIAAVDKSLEIEAQLPYLPVGVKLSTISVNASCHFSMVERGPKDLKKTWPPGACTTAARTL
tara:strand:+ start:207 stop:551 length:345 start_codon:yes stop_codon:yes gene_type:complete